MWELTDGTRHPTGYWAEELATPHRIFSEAGWSIDIATPGGVAPTAEKSSLGIASGMPGHRRRVTAYLDAIAADLTHPIPLDQVNETQYDLVFYPGGHGPMVDLAFDETSGSLLTRRLRSGKALGVAGSWCGGNPRGEESAQSLRAIAIRRLPSHGNIYRGGEAEPLRKENPLVFGG